jgi:ATP-dependent helicase HepA
MTVREVDDVDGCWSITASTGRTSRHPAGNPAVELHPVPPGQRPPVRRADRPAGLVSLRYNTLEHTSRQLQSSLWGLGGVRAQPIAHQLHIAREVADRIAPRVLLADEVGLGKTIEAGLVIHRQLLSGRANRVLILVPENLQHQWLVEMRRRFNLQVALFDEERFIESDAANPFEDTQLALVALEWLVDDEKAQDALFAAGWDLMVVDEAHHLVWHEDKVSPEYALVEQLAEVIPAYCCSPPPRNNSARTATSPVCACSTRTVSTTCRLPRRERELSPGGRSRAGAARQGPPVA